MSIFFSEPSEQNPVCCTLRIIEQHNWIQSLRFTFLLIVGCSFLFIMSPTRHQNIYLNVNVMRTSNRNYLLASWGIEAVHIGLESAPIPGSTSSAVPASSEMTGQLWLQYLAKSNGPDSAYRRGAQSNIIDHQTRQLSIKTLVCMRRDFFCG